MKIEHKSQYFSSVLGSETKVKQPPSSFWLAFFSATDFAVSGKDSLIASIEISTFSPAPKAERSQQKSRKKLFFVFYVVMYSSIFSYINPNIPNPNIRPSQKT
jgi:hypothetical protein